MKGYITTSDGACVGVTLDRDAYNSLAFSFKLINECFKKNNVDASITITETIPKRTNI